MRAFHIPLGNPSEATPSILYNAAPPIIGNPIRNAIRAASGRPYPRVLAMVMLIPERLTPGNKAKH